VSGTAKAMEVWNLLLERAQGEEALFRGSLDAFQQWAADEGPNGGAGNEQVRLAAKAIRFRLILREGKPLCVRWGMQ
jgi:hypothetical protein